MADSTIHALPAKGQIVDLDEFYFVRSPYGAGSDFKITGKDLKTSIGGTTHLVADITLYVNADTGIDTNFGGPSDPFKTIFGAWLHLCSLNQNGFTVTIQLQDAVATYPGLTIYANSGPFSTLIVPFSSGDIVINGNATDPAKTTISGDIYDYCFEINVSFPNQLSVTNVKLAAASLFYSAARCDVTFYGKLILGNGTTTFLGFYAGTGTILNVGGDKVLNFMPSGAVNFIYVYNSYASYYGTMDVEPAAQDFASGFVKVVDGGVFYWYPSPITNANFITGPAYVARAGGDIDIADNGVVPIPGGKGIMYPNGTHTEVMKGMPLAQLPNAFSTGVRLTVTDATAPVFGQPVVGGGAVVTPVYWDGAAWMVG